MATAATAMRLAMVVFSTVAITRAQGGIGAFPRRPAAEPASIARGGVAYKTNCAYCHGADARGGENGGNNLLRADVVMKDQSGELLQPFLAGSSIPDHTFRFSPTEATELAAFVHDFRLNSRDPGRMRPATIVVGNAKAGETYFKAKCSTCHSATGDLKGIATQISDPTTLQQTWLMPLVTGPRAGAPVEGIKVPPMTVTVTLAAGEKLEGRLGRVDDFLVSVIQADGPSRTIRRDGNTPKVEIHDPLKPHKDLLPIYTDTEIHTVTAYLVTLQ